MQCNWGQSHLERDHSHQDGNALSQDEGDDSEDLENVVPLICLATATNIASVVHFIHSYVVLIPLLLVFR